MSPLLAIYRLLLRHQLTKGRIVLIVLMSALALVVGFFIGRSNPEDAMEAATGFVWFFGIGLMVPIVSLVLASGSLGDLVDDETLVYLWHRPTPRWMLAAAAWFASATVAVPATAVPLGISAMLASEYDRTATTAAVLSVAVAAIGYSGLFTLLGLMLRRALIWGLMYLFIWELFVARVGNGAATLALGTYPSSILSQMTDIEIPLATRSTATGTIVPLVIAAVAVALTAWRLDHTDVA